MTITSHEGKGGAKQQVGVVWFWRVEEPKEMAADNEREYRELLTDALINSQVHNSYTMDEFKELFPRKYR